MNLKENKLSENIVKLNNKPDKDTTKLVGLILCAAYAKLKFSY